MISRIAAFCALVGALCGALPAAAQTVPYKIVTASERGTYIQIGRDIAKYVAPAAGIELEVLSSAGSAENVQRLRREPGVKLALVQSDVYQAFLDQDAAGNAEAGTLIRPLRVVMPLYNEEIYFIVRADSPLTSVHEIRGQKINVGPLLSGTAMSATTLYRQMFNTALPEATLRVLPAFKLTAPLLVTMNSLMLRLLPAVSVKPPPARRPRPSINAFTSISWLACTVVLVPVRNTRAINAASVRPILTSAGSSSSEPFLPRGALASAVPRNSSVCLPDTSIRPPSPPYAPPRALISPA